MKTFTVTENVKIKNPDGSIRATVPVNLNGYIDEFTGEKSFTAAELMKLDRIKAQYAGIMLPDEIKALRKRFNKTQEEMCAILGMGKKTWTRWETGAIIPNSSMCKTLFLLREGKISLRDLCTQEDRCTNWFGKSGIRCENCNGVASQFAAMKKQYVKKIDTKEIDHEPHDLELVA